MHIGQISGLTLSHLRGAESDPPTIHKLIALKPNNIGT